MKILAMVKCAMSISCPAIYDLDDGTAVIIGKNLTRGQAVKVAGMIGDDEVAVSVPMELLKELQIK